LSILYLTNVKLSF